jgi:hypothetical protein
VLSFFFKMRRWGWEDHAANRLVQQPVDNKCFPHIFRAYNLAPLHYFTKLKFTCKFLRPNCYTSKHWRTLVLEKRVMDPPTKIQFALYYLVFVIFHHVKNKIIQINSLNCHLISFSPSNNYGQGPPLLANNYYYYLLFGLIDAGHHIHAPVAASIKVVQREYFFS